MAEAELAEGAACATQVEGRPIVVARSGGQVFALDDLCTHSGARLSQGRIAKGVAACPLHGARFDLSTGACLSLAMGLPGVVAHETRVADGRITVALSDRPVTAPVV
jgi:3-phenylpropionate/trans-cinnamate dioxygenase ferredoxin subunit